MLLLNHPSISQRLQTSCCFCPQSLKSALSSTPSRPKCPAQPVQEEVPREWGAHEQVGKGQTWFSRGSGQPTYLSLQLLPLVVRHKLVPRRGQVDPLGDQGARGHQ